MFTTETSPSPHSVRPALGHVNLMVDTFIANASADDLRCIARHLLSTGSPSFTVKFMNAARTRLHQTKADVPPSPCSLFARKPGSSTATPTAQLHDALHRARSLYGAGMGFASLGVLTSIVRASIGLRWEKDGAVESLLVIVDADIGQAIQSSKGEIEGGGVGDTSSARQIQIVEDLREALDDSGLDTELWGGDFPFERSSWSCLYWKI